MAKTTTPKQGRRPSEDAIMRFFLEMETTVTINGKPERMTYLKAILLRIAHGYAKGEHPHYELAHQLGFIDKPEPFIFEVGEDEVNL